MNELIIAGHCPFCGNKIRLQPYDRIYGYGLGQQPKWNYRFICELKQDYHVLNLNEIVDEQQVPRKSTCAACPHWDEFNRLCCAGGEQSYLRDMTNCSCREGHME